MGIGTTGLLGSTGTSHVTTPVIPPVVTTTTSAVLPPVAPTPAPTSGVSYVSTIPSASSVPPAAVLPAVTPAPTPVETAPAVPAPSPISEALAPITTTVTTTAAAAITPPPTAPVEQPVAAQPAPIDQTTDTNPDPTQVALAATAAATSMLAPAPFGPTIIIPAENSLNVVATTPPPAIEPLPSNPQPTPQPPAEQPVAEQPAPAPQTSTTTTTTAAQPSQAAVASKPTPTKVSLYELFQNTIAAEREAQSFLPETKAATIGATLAAGAVQRSISDIIAETASSLVADAQSNRGNVGLLLDSSQGASSDPTPKAHTTTTAKKTAAA